MRTLLYRSLALWLLGYPEAALADSNRAIAAAREIGQAATLMPALNYTCLVYIHCGEYAVAKAGADEVVLLADQKRFHILEDDGNHEPGLRIGTHGHAFRRSAHDYVRIDCLAINAS
jgi:hypothetical protein